VKLRLVSNSRAISVFILVLALAVSGCNKMSFLPQGQTISFSQIPSQTLGSAPISLTATASSGLPVSLVSNTPAICTVSGTATGGFQVTLVATGTCSIVATQIGNSTYAAATPVSQSFTVQAAPLTAQIITFATPATQTVGTPLTLTATATSGLAVSFASTTQSVCTVSGTTATFLTAGTCTINATQAGNSTYAAATPVTRSFTVQAAPLTAQTISFATPATQTVGTSLTLTATATSGLAVSFASTTQAVCSVSGTTATFLTAGTCTINATQLGNSTYAAATPVTRSFAVQAAPLIAQTISFATPATQTVGTPLTLTATATSGLAVSFASTTQSVCTVSGTTATFLAAGTCTINATQAGNSTYAAATPVARSFTVQAAPLIAQTITFNPIQPQNLGMSEVSFTITAAASSGLPITYTALTGSVCSVAVANGVATVTLFSQDICTIQADQPGNSTYAAAPSVTQSFPVMSFWASSNSVTLGQSYTLWWHAPNASSVAIDQGVDTQGSTWSFVTITPTNVGATTYTMSATYPAGIAKVSIAVSVNAPTATSPRQLTIENHWMGNSGGHYYFPPDGSLQSQIDWNGNTQNFLTDIGVYSDPNIYGGVPIVYTLTTYDETGLGNYNPNPTADQIEPNPYMIQYGGSPVAKTLGGEYYGGYRVGKGFSSTVATQVDSRLSVSAAAVNKGLSAHVENFYGRFFNSPYEYYNTTPPPAYPDSSAPYVSLSDGRKITVVTDPTAVDFDNSGLLWISDNGPDQNIKIFDVSSASQSLTTPVKTFGAVGGIYGTNGTAYGSSGTPLAGQMGDFRFWGIRGIAHDADGNIYVGSSGMNAQNMGGADIRQFTADGTTLNWKNFGLFVNVGDADPASGATEMYVDAKHFTMDYSKAPGKSWTYSSVTFDPFLYPEDPRLLNAFGVAWIRRIAGQRFLYLTDMDPSKLLILRFLPNSEIAVPTGFMSLIAKNLGPTDISPNHPTWDDNESNKRIRWWWLDNGMTNTQAAGVTPGTNAATSVAADGKFQSGEFGTWENWTSYSYGVNIDDAGGIWYGGTGTVTYKFNGNGIQYWPNKGVDANGVPIYDFANPVRFDVPFTDYTPPSNDPNGSTDLGQVNRMKYLSDTDTMFIAGDGNAWYPYKIFRYNNFIKDAHVPGTTTAANAMQPAFVIDLGTQSYVSGSHLDLNTAAETLPFAFTADQDYIYVTYLDQGKNSRKRGEVTIYSATDGHEIGWIVPGPEVGYYCGTIDLMHGINVSTEADHVTRDIILEDDGAAKVMVYRWNPAAK